MAITTFPILTSSVVDAEVGQDPFITFYEDHPGFKVFVAKHESVRFSALGHEFIAPDSFQCPIHGYAPACPIDCPC